MQTNLVSWNFSHAALIGALNWKLLANIKMFLDKSREHVWARCHITLQDRLNSRIVQGNLTKIIKNLAVKKEKMFSTSKLPTQIEAAAYSEPNIFDIKDVAQHDKNMKT